MSYGNVRVRQDAKDGHRRATAALNGSQSIDDGLVFVFALFARKLEAVDGSSTTPRPNTAARTFKENHLNLVWVEIWFFFNME